MLNKFFKRQRLLKKYRLTDKKRLDQIRLMTIMRDDLEFRKFYFHQIMCEIRCYNRIKKL